MKYEITVKTMALIGLATVICGLVGCDMAAGNKSTSDSNNDNSNNIITTGSASDDKEDCPKGSEIRYKPISESDGNLVVLFPVGYVFQEVCVEDLEENLECVYEYTITNGGRATYRFSKPGEQYTGLLITESCEFQVSEQ